MDLLFYQKSSLTARYDIPERSFHHLFFFLCVLKKCTLPFQPAIQSVIQASVRTGLCTHWYVGMLQKRHKDSMRPLGGTCHSKQEQISFTPFTGSNLQPALFIPNCAQLAQVKLQAKENMLRRTCMEAHVPRAQDLCLSLGGLLEQPQTPNVSVR